LTAYKSEKLIVYKQCLAELLEQCSRCRHCCSLKWTVKGTFVSVLQHCQSCDHKHRWASQPMVKDLPEGNLLLSASILFSGASFAKVSRVFSAMNISSISQSTFYDHNKKLLQPTIISLWNDTQKQLLDWLSQRPGEIVLGGDMRADSPGHSAKFGSYTVMELRSNRVLHISLVQVRRLTS